jgi:hypothetical protein
VVETGEVKEVYNGNTNTPFNVFLNPAFVSRYKPTPGMKLLIDIYDKTGETNIAPRKVRTYVTKNGIKIPLTKEEIEKFQIDAGKSTMESLDKLVDSPAFNNLKTDYAKAEYIYNKVINTEMKKARTRLINSLRPDDKRYLDGLKAEREKYGR